MLPIKFESGSPAQALGEELQRGEIRSCVVVFAEPLESTGIVTISAAAEMIADFLPGTGDNFEPAAKTFNDLPCGATL